jgi:hypothetical protein
VIEIIAKAIGQSPELLTISALAISFGFFGWQLRDWTRRLTAVERYVALSTQESSKQAETINTLMVIVKRLDTIVEYHAAEIERIRNRQES